MKCTILFAAALAVLNLGGWALSAEDTVEPETKNLEPLCRAVRKLVRRYYPEASVSASYDKKIHAEKICVDYNTMTYVVRDAGGDDSSEGPVKVRGPYVGGVWCEMTLLKGRYAGPVAEMDKGVTEPGPDFYNRIVAPYSKKLDRHLAVTLRYPGGTPPPFLRQFDALVKDFDRYVKKPAE